MRNEFVYKVMFPKLTVFLRIPQWWKDFSCFSKNFKCHHQNYSVCFVQINLETALIEPGCAFDYCVGQKTSMAKKLESNFYFYQSMFKMLSSSGCEPWDAHMASHWHTNRLERGSEVDPCGIPVDKQRVSDCWLCICTVLILVWEVLA